MTSPAPLPEEGGFDGPPQAAPRRRRTETTRRSAPHRSRAGTPGRSHGRGAQSYWSTEQRRSSQGRPPQAAQQQGRSAAAARAYARRAERSGRAEKIRGGRGKRPFPAPTAMLSSRATFVVCVMSLLAVGVVATLWLSTQATAGTYKLNQVRQDVASLSNQVADVRAQVARAQSPASLAARARQIGMVPAGVPAHLVVGDDGKVTVVGTPKKVTSGNDAPAAAGKPEGNAQDASHDGGGTDAGDSAHRQAAPNPEGGGD